MKDLLDIFKKMYNEQFLIQDFSEELQIELLDLMNLLDNIKQIVEKYKWKAIDFIDKETGFSTTIILYDIILNNKYTIEFEKPFVIVGWTGNNVKDAVAHLSAELHGMLLIKEYSIDEIRDIDDNAVKDWLKKGYYSFHHLPIKDLSYIEQLKFTDVSDYHLADYSFYKLVE